MAHIDVHARCQWCGICMTCQQALARDSKCGDAQRECKRAATFRRMNAHTSEMMARRDADPDS